MIMKIIISETFMVIGDLLLINFSFIIAYLFRKQVAILRGTETFLIFTRYFITLIFASILYIGILWLLGFYKKRRSDSVLDELTSIFGAVSLATTILVFILFVTRAFWFSRQVLYSAWILLSVLLSAWHLLLRVLKKEYLKTAASIDATPRVSSYEPKNIKSSSTLSIVIVNTNDGDKIGNCLKSIFETACNINFETLVVDNNSTDGSVEMVKKEFFRVRVVENGRNLGYSKAVNNGIRASSGDYILILNPDIEVLPDAVSRVVSFLDETPKAAVAGCKLYNADGTLQLSCRRFFTLRSALYRFTPLRGLLINSQIEREHLMLDWGHHETAQVDWVLGGCMAIRRSALKETGYMDENLFLYFDDVDFCLRVWKSDWQVYYLPFAEMIHHHRRKSANKLLSRESREHIKSMLYFFRKYGFKIPEQAPSAAENK